MGIAPSNKDLIHTKKKMPKKPPSSSLMSRWLGGGKKDTTDTPVPKAPPLPSEKKKATAVKEQPKAASTPQKEQPKATTPASKPQTAAKPVAGSTDSASGREIDSFGAFVYMNGAYVKGDGKTVHKTQEVTKEVKKEETKIIKGAGGVDKSTGRSVDSFGAFIYMNG